jgi:hypothetical protein
VTKEHLHVPAASAEQQNPSAVPACHAVDSAV